MENNLIFSDEDIKFINNLPEVILAKSKLSDLNVVNFSILLTDTIKNDLSVKLGLKLDLSEIPMRWIKGDTHNHTDKSNNLFENTYLVYLSDCPGEFIINDNHYPIKSNSAFKFNEGVYHKTSGTKDIPRLLLGPMNEFGLSVGALPTIIDLTFNITVNTTITLPLIGTSLVVITDWGDTTSDNLLTHTYNQGTYTVSVYLLSGTYSSFGAQFWQGAQFLTSINYWGPDFTSLSKACFGATHLISVPTSLPTSCTSLNLMFYNAILFNQDLSTWDTSLITDMYGMFDNATNFNGNISNWDTSSVTTMLGMFKNAISFNQNLSTWNTSSVTNMVAMFYNASSFNQDISTWGISSVTDMNVMLNNCGLNTANYDLLLNGWAISPHNNIQLGSNGLFYTSVGQVGRNILTGTYGWTITGDNLVEPPICYLNTTKILCIVNDSEEYIPIELLKPNTLVKTYLHGNIPVENVISINFFNNPSKWSECMYRLPKTDEMIDDLIVTGGHGILKSNLSIEEINLDSDWFKFKRYSFIDNLYLQRAAFCKDFEKINNESLYTVYHLSLKSKSNRRYGIWANGILSESTFKKDTNRFI